MTQLSLIQPKEISFNLAIDYDGLGELLQNEIDATAYATSISGYTKFLKEVLSTISGKDIEIYITSHQEGSFKSILKIGFNIFVGYSAIASVLSFHGYNFDDIKNIAISYSKEIIQNIIKSSGDTNDIIKKIQNNKNIPESAKNILIDIITNNKARMGLDEFTSPLDKKDYEKITVSTNQENIYTINKDDRKAFKYTPPDIEIEEKFTEVVTILYLSPELTEWKFQGKKMFWAEVKDKDFLNQTKNKTFSQLEGKRYAVSGIVKTIKKEGASKGKSFWSITKATEIQETYELK